MISSTAAPETLSASFKYTERDRKIAWSLSCVLPLPAHRMHTYTHPSPVHKGSLSCSAQPCNVCERQELPYSHSLNRLLSPSWLGGCSHSCFNPWEQRHDSKQLFTHRSGLPSATSSSFSPPFFLVCWVRIFFFFFFYVFFFNPGSNQNAPSSSLCLSVSLSKKCRGKLLPPPWTISSPGLPLCSVAVREGKNERGSEHGREGACKQGGGGGGGQRDAGGRSQSVADCFVSRAVPTAPSLPPAGGGLALLMVCTNLFHFGRGTSPCDRRKSQGRL